MTVDLQRPFLLIGHGGFSVHADALAEPWMMTRTAMDNFRNAVCYDGSGTTCTVPCSVPASSSGKTTKPCPIDGSSDASI
ncbi:hypothetical protein, partial [Planktothrix agardhii]|uniref:hypothetical protein n=1 Tax=Planktothrix agardhii TaxID=1160 RepID=UPI001F23511E